MRSYHLLRKAAPLLAATVTACASAGLRSPVRRVDGTDYFVASGSVANTAMPELTERLAWQNAASELARARSTEVASRLTEELRAQLSELAKRRGIEGTISLIETATSRVPLRSIHKLALRAGRDRTTVVLGIPMGVWTELVDEAASDLTGQLRASTYDPGPSPQRY